MAVLRPVIFLLRLYIRIIGFYATVVLSEKSFSIRRTLNNVFFLNTTKAFRCYDLILKISCRTRVVRNYVCNYKTLFVRWYFIWTRFEKRRGLLLDFRYMRTFTFCHRQSISFAYGRYIEFAFLILILQILKSRNWVISKNRLI